MLESIQVYIQPPNQTHHSLSLVKLHNMAQIEKFVPHFFFPRSHEYDCMVPGIIVVVIVVVC